MREIILIGNGAGLLGKKLGKEIDRFPKVVRMNRFVIRDFEEDLGEKTDIHIGNRENLRRYPKRAMCGEQNIFCVLPDAEKQFAKKIKNLNLKLLPSSVKRFGGQLTNAHCCTTGFALILYYSLFFDQVWIAGFDFAESAHYFDDTHRHHRGHSWRKEKELVLQWVRMGKVKALDA